MNPFPILPSTSPQQLGPSLKCPGQFCGRLTNLSTVCGPCPWGSRRTWPSHTDDICHQCLHTPTVYASFYLGFMAILPMLFLLSYLPNDSNGVRHIFSSVVRSTYHVEQLHLDQFISTSWLWGLALLVLHTLNALIVVLLFPPFGTLSLYSCDPQAVTEFYAFLHGRGCSYEVAFPYLSLPLAYYALNAACSIGFYSFACLFNRQLTPSGWSHLAQVSLYTYPVLCLITLAFSGFLYFGFSYMLLAFGLIHSLYQFPVLFDYCLLSSPDDNVIPVANPVALIIHVTRNFKPVYLWTILVSVFCYSYSLSAQNRSLWWILVLTTVPFAFYLATLPFTHPFVLPDSERSMKLAYMKPEVNDRQLAPLAKAPSENPESKGA